MDDQVVIPWGQWVSTIALMIGASAAAIVAFAFRLLPAEWVAIMKSARVDQLLEKAIQYGANTTADATVNQTMTVPVANNVIEGSIEYALNHAPGLVKWAGGAEAIRQKIIARLDIEKAGAVAG